MHKYMQNQDPLRDLYCLKQDRILWFMSFFFFLISIFSLVRSSGAISIPYFLVLLLILGPSCGVGKLSGS